MKVSFDFDGTLSRPSIQRYAKRLLSSGIEVHITTSRCFFIGGSVFYDNTDLFYVADSLGIKRENILFTQGNWKCEYLSSDFVFHLDNDKLELSKIKNIPAVDVNKSFSIRECDILIDDYEEK